MSRYYSVLVITVVVINGLHCTSIHIPQVTIQHHRHRGFCCGETPGNGWWEHQVTGSSLTNTTIAYIHLYTYLDSPSCTTDTEVFVVSRLQTTDGGNIWRQEVLWPCALLLQSKVVEPVHFGQWCVHFTVISCGQSCKTEHHCHSVSRNSWLKLF